MTSNLYAPNPTPSPLTPWVELSSERRLGRLHNYAGRGFTLACAAKMLATAPWELELFIQGLPGRQQPVFPASVTKSGSDVWADLSPEERDHLALRPEPRNQIAGMFGFHLTTIRVWARKRDLLRRELPAKPKPPAAPRKRERTGVNYVPDPTAEKLWFRLSLPERDEYIRGQDAANTSRISSAKALGVKITTLQKYANERGIFKTKPSSSNPHLAGHPWHDADVQGKRELLMRMAPNYGSKTELAKALRIGRDTLYNFTQRQKLDLPMGQPGQRRPAAPRARPALVPGSTQPAPRAWLAAQADRPPADTPTRVHLLDARRNQCRFPLWPDAPKPKLADMFYCGAPVVNELESFCAHCLGLVRSRAPTAEEREEARQAYARNVRNGRPSGIKFGT